MFENYAQKMIRTIVPKTEIKDPGKLPGFHPKIKSTLLLLAEQNNLIFQMPNIDFSIIDSNKNKAKRIFKVGFLDDFYTQLYPEKSRKELVQIVIEKHDLFIDLRQYQKDVKCYMSKKTAIFAVCI